MQVEVKLLFSSPAEAAAFLAADPVDIRYAVTKSVDTGPLTDIHGSIASEAPGKPSAAPTAPSRRTAEAGPSTSAHSADAPETQTTATEPDAPASSASQPAEFDYQTLAKAVNAAVPKHGKDTLLAIATKHGAANFKALKPEAWKAAYDDVVALGA